MAFSLQVNFDDATFLIGENHTPSIIDNRANRSNSDGAVLRCQGFSEVKCTVTQSVASGSYSSSSSSVVSCTTDTSGRPQVFCESSSVQTATGGVKQTIHAVQDSRTGLQKMAIGRHIQEKGHVVEKKRNVYTGDREENEEYINLADDEMGRFNKEWQNKTRAFNGTSRSRRQPKRPKRQPLAITAGPS